LTLEYGIHGKKLISLLSNDRVCQTDKKNVEKAIELYEKSIGDINDDTSDNIGQIVNNFTETLNVYKFFIEFNLIFMSDKDFLYRQKGQLKLDNSITEEFISLLTNKCIAIKYPELDIHIAPQIQTYSSLHFDTSMKRVLIAGGLTVKEKNQDFSLSRKIYIKASHSKDFDEIHTKILETNIGYIVAEFKTNLDKTMFQEAIMTAHDVKNAVYGAKYFLVCDYLDMPPFSSNLTDIDEILILRKARRISNNIRQEFNTYLGRQTNKNYFAKFLSDNPYSKAIISRLIDHIMNFIATDGLTEEEILNNGYF
jgi:hypothetical protein